MELNEVNASSPISNDAKELIQGPNESLVKLQTQNIKCNEGHAMTKSSRPNYVCNKCSTSNLEDHWRCGDCDVNICFDCAKKGPGVFEKIASSKIGRDFMDNCVVRFVKRMIPLLLAVWIKVDMILDVRQSIIYYRHGFSDAEYAEWALRYQNETNSTYLQSVSRTYFITASAIWVTTPLLLSTFFLIVSKAPIPFIRVLLSKILDFHLDFLDEKWFSILLGMFLIPFDGLVSGIII